MARRRIVSLVLMMVVSGFLLWSLLPRSAQGANAEEPSPADVPGYECGEGGEFYKAFHDTTNQRIARQREKIDLDSIARYRTTVKETGESVTIAKELFSVSFSRRTCSIGSAVLRGHALERVRLPNMVIEDRDGMIYRQSNAIDGNLSVKDEKFHIFLEGSFTPRSSVGKPFGAKIHINYKFYKMSGLFTVNFQVEQAGASPTVRSVRISNSLGDTPRRLDKLFLANTLSSVAKLYYLGGFKTVASDEDQIVNSGPVPLATWSDGNIGFQVMPLTPFREMDVAASAGQERYVATRVQDEVRYIDVNLILQPGGVPVPSGFKAAEAFSVFPFRKFRPRPAIYEGASEDIAFHAWTGDEEESLKRKAQGGATIIAGWGVSPFPKEEDLDRLRNQVMYCHKYGIKVFAFFNTYPADDEAVARGILSSEEYEDAISGGEGLEGTKNSAHFRQYWLSATNIAMKLGFDGVYLDCISVDQAGADGAAAIEGNTKLVEDVRLLLDSYGEDKILFVHSGDDMTCVEAMADYTVPGEPLDGGGFEALEPARLDILYNPLLSGVQVLQYGQRSYNLTTPTIYKQMLKYSVSGMVLNYDRAMPGTYQSILNFTEKEWEIYRRYMFPQLIFDTRRTELHSPVDQDYGEYVKVNNKRAWANLYSRPGEALLTIVNEPYQRDTVDITLNLRKLGMATPDVLVYDVIAESCTEQKAGEGLLQIGKIDLTREPRVFLLRQKPSHPSVIWRGFVFREVSSTKYGREEWADWNKLDINAKTIPGGKGILCVYCGEYGKPDRLVPGNNAGIVSYDRVGNVAHILTGSETNELGITLIWNPR